LWHFGCTRWLSPPSLGGCLARWPSRVSRLPHAEGRWRACCILRHGSDAATRHGQGWTLLPRFSCLCRQARWGRRGRVLLSS
jgi:hypothetical protein